MSNDLCNGGPPEGKQCECRLTQVHLREDGVRSGQICPECKHTLGRHAVGQQGE
jgi:hypothetical protein